MAKVSLENLSPGMILADDAVAGNNILLGKGAALTQKHISVFKQWGLIELDIEGVSDRDLAKKATAEINPEILDLAKKKVVPFFRHNNLKYEPIIELCRICILRKVKELSENKGKESDD